MVAVAVAVAVASAAAIAAAAAGGHGPTGCDCGVTPPGSLLPALLPPALAQGGDGGPGAVAGPRVLSIIGSFNPVILDAPHDVAVNATGHVFVAVAQYGRIEVFSPGGEYLYSIGEKGRGPGQLDRPEGVAVNATGHVFVTDAGTGGRLQVFGPNGSHLAVLAGAGSGRGSLSIPGGVAVGPNGIVYVADTGNSRVLMFAPGGSYLARMGSSVWHGGTLLFPTGVAVGPSRSVYVADFGLDRIGVFGSNRQPQPAISYAQGADGHVDRPYGVAVDPEDGRVYATSFGGHRVVAYGAGGAHNLTFGAGLLDAPTGVAVHPASGDVYVSDRGSNHIDVFGRNGSHLRTIGSGEHGEYGLSHPLGASPGPGGRIAVADTQNDRVLVYAPNSTRGYAHELTVGGNGSLRSPSGVAFGPGGEIYVADQGNARLQVFGPGGEHARTISEAAGPLQSPSDVDVDEAGRIAIADNQTVVVVPGPGQGGDPVRLHGFKGPGGVALDSLGRLIVADTFNGTVQVLAPNGTRLLDMRGFGQGPGAGGALPAGVGAGPHGKIFVAEASGDRVHVFDYAGRNLTSFGSFGEAQGMLDAPRDVAVGPDGAVVVADSGNGRVQVFGQADAVPPRPLSASLHPPRPASGTYGEGDVIAVAVNFTEPVRVDSPPGAAAPSLVLNMTAGGAAAPAAALYSAGNNTAQLVFSYAVGAGDRAPAVAYGPAGPFDLGESFIVGRDDGNLANLTALPPSPGPAGGQAADVFTNRPPSVGPVARQSVALGSELLVELRASDPDGDGVQFRLEEPAPSGALVRPDGVLAWTPSAGQVGMHVINVSAADEHGLRSAAAPVRVEVLASGILNASDSPALRSSAEIARIAVPFHGSLNASDSPALRSDASVRVGHVDAPGPRVLSVIGSANPVVLDAPHDVAVDATGHVFVAVAQYGRIEVFSPGGEYLYSIGEKGRGSGQLDRPEGIAVNATGHVFVTDAGTGGRLQVFGPNGSHLAVLAGAGSGRGSLSIPGGVAVGPNGIVYVADTGNSRVLMFAPGGSYLARMGSSVWHGGTLLFPTGVAVGPSRSVYVADFGLDRIGVFGSNRQPQPAISYAQGADGRVDRPYGVAVDPEDGRVYATSFGGNRVVAYGADRAYHSTFGAGLLDAPSGVAVHPASGDVYVSDRGSNHIDVFGRNGSHLRTIGSGEHGEYGLSHPLGASPGPGGRIAVADTQNDRVLVYAPNSTRGYAHELTVGGNGSLRSPSGVAFGPGGEIYVADQGNARLQVFGPGGEHARTISEAAGPLQSPSDVDVDGAGRIAIADNQTVVVVPGPGQGGDPVRLHGFKGPGGVALDSLGRLIVADTFNGTVQVLAPNGTRLLDMRGFGQGPGAGGALPAGVGAGPHGKIFVAEASGDRVHVFDYAGRNLTSFGSFGEAQGMLDAPRDVAVGPDGSVVVADSGNGRVQVFGQADAVPPRPLSASLHPPRPASGTYGEGDVIAVAVNFTEPVRVDSPPGAAAPSLVLNMTAGGAAAPAAALYSAGNNTAQLVFSYAVGAGDRAPAVAYAPAGPFDLGGSFIVGRDDGNLANLTALPPSPGPAGGHAADVFTNRPPSVEPVSRQSVALGSELLVELRASDPDGDGVRLMLDDPAPSGAALRPDGVLAWTPAPGQVGMHVINVSAADEHGLRSAAEGVRVSVFPARYLDAHDSPALHSAASARAGPAAYETPAVLSAAFTARNAATIVYSGSLGPPAGHEGPVYGEISVDSNGAGSAGSTGGTVPLAREDVSGLGTATHRIEFGGDGVDSGQAGSISLATRLEGRGAGGAHLRLEAGAIPVQAGETVRTIVQEQPPALGAPPPPAVVIEPDGFTRAVDATGAGGAARPAINVTRLAAQPGGAAEFPAESVRMIAVFAEVTFPANSTALSVPPGGLIALYASDDVPPPVDIAAALGLDAGSLLVRQVVEIGDRTTHIAFDAPVRILLVGQAGGAAFYVNSTDGAVVPITVQCGKDSTAAAAEQLGDAGECWIDTPAGGKAIHTRHLTRFGTAEAAGGPPPAPPGAPEPVSVSVLQRAGGDPLRAPALYTAGQEIAIAVEFSAPVSVGLAGGGGSGGSVGGTPRLLLDTGSAGAAAPYTSGNGTARLEFSYTVRGGDITDRLSYAGTGALALGGGSIVAAGADTAAAAASAALPAPGTPGSLSGPNSPAVRIAPIGRPVLDVGVLDEAGPAGFASRAAYMAAAEFNERQGRIDGALLVNVSAYGAGGATAGSAAEALRAAHSSGAGPSVYVGPSTDRGLHAAMPYASEHGIVLVSAGSTAPSLAVGDDTVFRLLPSDRLEAEALARLAYSGGDESVHMVVDNATYGPLLGGTLDDAAALPPPQGGFFHAFGAALASAAISPLSSTATLGGGGGGGEGGGPYEAGAAAAALDASVRSAGASGSPVSVVYLGSPEGLAALAESSASYPALASASWLASGLSAGSALLAGGGAAAGFAADTGLVAPSWSPPASEAGRQIDSQLSGMGPNERNGAYAAYDAVLVLGAAAAAASAEGGRGGGTTDAAAIADGLPAAAALHSGALGDIALDYAGDLWVPAKYDLWTVAQPGGGGGTGAEWERQPEELDGERACSITLTRARIDYGPIDSGQTSRPHLQTIVNTGQLPFAQVDLSATPWHVDSPGACAPGDRPSLPVGLSEIRTELGGRFLDLAATGTTLAQGLEAGSQAPVWYRLSLVGYADLPQAQITQCATYVVRCS